MFGGRCFPTVCFRVRLLSRWPWKQILTLLWKVPLTHSMPLLRWKVLALCSGALMLFKRMTTGVLAFGEALAAGFRVWCLDRRHVVAEDSRASNQIRKFGWRLGVQLVFAWCPWSRLSWIKFGGDRCIISEASCKATTETGRFANCCWGEDAQQGFVKWKWPSGRPFCLCPCAPRAIQSQPLDWSHHGQRDAHGVWGTFLRCHQVGRCNISWQVDMKTCFFPLWRGPLELTDQPGRRRALIRVENTAWMGMAQCCVRLATRRWPPPGYKDHWRLRRVRFLQGDFESVEASRTSYFAATVVDTPLRWPNADVATGYDSLLL